MKLLGGPVSFLVVYLVITDELSPEGRLVLATFAWCAVWWVTQPIPWAVTSLLPLAIFPLLGVMRAGETAALYGQNIFFWIFGTVMLGYAMEKHGLAKRFSLRLLSLRGVAKTTYRLTFMYMLVTALVSMFISDAAAVAMMIPIGMSIVAFLSRMKGEQGKGERSALGAFFALGALCAAEAGGDGTISGLPHNALAVAMGTNLTGRTIGWFEWMMVGVPLFITMLVTYYLILRFFFPPEFSTIPGGKEFIERERAKLGKMSRGEVNVLITFVCMVTLFMLPPMLSLLLGEGHALSVYLRASLPIWVVPPIVLFLLFLLPVDVKKGEGTLVWRDAVEHAPWNIMLLCTGAVAMTSALARFGLMEFMQGSLQSLGLTSFTLPYVAAAVMGLSTNIISGLAATSLFSGIFIPMASDLGFNPASMTMLIPMNAVGIMVPWAGAAAGTAFATGHLELREMIKIGAVATVFNIVFTASIHLLFSPLL